MYSIVVQTSDKVLLAMEMAVDRDIFMRQQNSFVVSIERLLKGSGYPDVLAAMHGYTVESQLR